VIFTSPVARIRTGRPDIRQPLPLGQLAALPAALGSADPVPAAMTALIAYHGLRTQDTRRLQLTDVDGLRLRIGGR
jgi:integrase